MSFKYQQYFTDFVMNSTAGYGVNIDVEVRAYGAARLEKQPLDDVNTSSAIYRATCLNDDAAFKRSLNDAACYDAYALFDKYIVARAALCGNKTVLRYFIDNVDQHYRGKLHQSVAKLLNLYIETQLAPVRDAVVVALANINKVEPINWGIWNGKLVNEAIMLCHSPSSSKTENVFRLLCEQGAYYDNIRPDVSAIIEKGLSIWYRTLSNWPVGDYVEHKSMHVWLEKWLGDRGLSAIDVIPEANPELKPILMKMLHL